MRFETDILTLGEDFFGRLKLYQCEHPPREGLFSNSACRDSILGAGWVLPRARGSRIVLVFSTTRVRGASKAYRWQLARAGRIAMRRHTFITNERTDDQLWWWPEIVCD